MLDFNIGNSIPINKMYHNVYMMLYMCLIVFAWEDQRHQTALYFPYNTLVTTKCAYNVSHVYLFISQKR